MKGLTLKAGAIAALLIFSLSAFAQALPAPKTPEIPANTVSILDFGGVADGITSNTEAFSKAVSALVKKGGGHLVVPEGIFLTGPIQLKDCMDLHLEKGAIIMFSPDKKEFLDEGKVVPCIKVSKRHDVSISGEGIIDGNGAWWRPVKRSKVSDVEWKEFLKKGGEVTEDGSLWYPFGLKNMPNIADDAKAQESQRTHLVRFTDCDRISVTGVTLQNAPKFHLVPQRCSNVTIEDITVRCPWNAQNGDGIDLMQSSEVVVRGCTVDVGDDGICLKAGAGEKALKDGPCKNILIENNTVFHAHGGFVIGSEFSAGIQNVIVRHNVFSGTDTGLRFKSAPERGGLTSGIRISDIVMTDIKDQAVVFETSYVDRPVGREDNQAAKTVAFLPDFTDIVMERVVCRGCGTAVKAGGTLQTVHGITIRNSTFFYNDKSTEIDDPAMVTLENVTFRTF